MTDSPAFLSKSVKKPNDEEFKKLLEQANQSIEKIQKQYDAVREKITKLPAKSDNNRREEIKTELNEIRDKQAELKKSRKAVYEQLDAINDSIRKKVNAIKGFQSKIPFKTIAEVDARILELESKIEEGMLQEITLLKRNRLSVEDVVEQQKEIDRERSIHDEIKKNIDESEANKLSDRYEQLDLEFKSLSSDQNKQREARNQLYDERNRLKQLLDEEYGKLRKLRDEHRKANDEYYEFMRQLRDYKKKQEELRKVQEEADKRQEAAKLELELASLPAFENEIALCDNLSAFLEGFISNASVKENTPTTDVKHIAGAFEGMVIKKKDDDVFFAGNTKKKQQKSSTPKEKKTDTLKIPLTTMEAFFEIKVTVPTKISEIPITLQKLKERKQYYIDEQPKVTAENKRQAEEKIKSMQKAEEEAKAREEKAKEEKVKVVTEEIEAQ
ncbi:hypothetical protein BDB01DRAFT_718945 [Pilobolus umbonatus]|nr:hypothetical protein BDB01DRAFT_718945 [Pilobolus umbonatus]